MTSLPDRSSAGGRRILLVADKLTHLHAGTESQMLLLCRGLQTRGWQVELALLRDAGTVRDAWPGPVTEIGVQRLASLVSWWHAWRFARGAKRRGFRLAQVFFNDAAILMPPCLAAAGIRVIVSRRDMGFWYTPGILRALRVARRFVGRVIANSRAVAVSVAAREGYDTGQMSVIYNGADLQASAQTAAAAPDAPPVIGLVANIRPVKRVEDAIEVFGRIAARHPGACLEIVGDGDTTSLRARAAALGVGDRVRFTGRVTDVTRRLAGYAVCLLTSESEGLSNSIIEYMLAGRAVLCTDIGGNPELIRHEETGLMYPVGDVTDLARHLDRLLGDPAERERLGAAARAWAEKTFALDAMLDAHERIYETVLGGRTPITSGAVPMDPVQ